MFPVHKYAVAFDLELDKLLEPVDSPTSKSWEKYDNCPGITCASTFCNQDGSKLFLSKDSRGNILQKMTRKDCKVLLEELWSHYENGAIIISWGGTAVDFRALYCALNGDSESQLKCLEIIRNHVDVTISSATDMGIMMGLNAAAKGTLQGEKSNDVSTEAPKLWKNKHFNEVLKHVKHDALLTLKVYEFITSNNPPSLTWQTKSGKSKMWTCSFMEITQDFRRLYTVMECLLKPMPKVPYAIVPGMNRDVAVEWLLQEDNFASCIVNARNLTF